MITLRSPLRRWFAAIACSLAACTAPAWAAGFTFTPYPHPQPLDLSAVHFVNAQKTPMTLADFKGKVIVLNIWATWCPPCVHEMPTLDKLEKILGGPDFAVIPLSVDKGGVFTVKSFYDDNFISHLPIYVDPTTQVLDTLSVLGTPSTILINKQGEEVARTMGPEDWDSPSVIAQLKRYIAAPAAPHALKTSATAATH